MSHCLATASQPNPKIADQDDKGESARKASPKPPKDSPENFRKDFDRAVQWADHCVDAEDVLNSNGIDGLELQAFLNEVPKAASFEEERLADTKLYQILLERSKLDLALLLIHSFDKYLLRIGVIHEGK
jgi:hypothetical protein